MKFNSRNTAEPENIKLFKKMNNLVESAESGKTEKDWAGKSGEGPITPSSGISDFIQEIGKVEEARCTFMENPP